MKPTIEQWRTLPRTGHKLYRCPNTGEVIVALPDDDKAMCYCGKTNPKVADRLDERDGRGRTVVHFCYFLEPVELEEIEL